MCIRDSYKGGVREDGAPIQPNDDQKIMDKLTELWAKMCIRDRK